MRKLFILATAILIFTGCGEPSDNDGLITGVPVAPPMIACTLIGYVSSLEVSQTVDTTIPRYLAIAFNGNPIQYDPCDSSLADEGIVVQPTSSSLEMRIYFYPSTSLTNTYFPTGGGPASNLISYEIFGRNSCSDPLTLVTSKQQLSIPWSYNGSSGGCQQGYTAKLVESP